MDERIEYYAKVDYGDMVRRFCEQASRRIDEQTVEQVKGRLAELGYRKCSECTERQGYYLDAETIQRQQEHIAKLTIERDAYFEMVKRVQADCDARDDLIRDMARELRGLNDGGVPTDCMEYERRMRELGIEADA